MKSERPFNREAKLPASAKKRFTVSKKLVLILAFKELRHDWKATGVLLCVIVSIVTPLLILFGLKQGVINTQREFLLNDPCNLEIKMLGHYHLSPLWFEQKTKDSRIQFIIPITRFLNTDINIIDKENKNNSVDLIPTGQGDPLLKLTAIDAPVQNNEVLITHALAKRLHINKGEKIQSQLFRTVSNESQTSHASLIVKDILPDYSCLQRSAVLTTLDFLKTVEDFKEGQQVDLFKVENNKLVTLKKEQPNYLKLTSFNNSFPSSFKQLTLLPNNIEILRRCVMLKSQWKPSYEEHKMNNIMASCDNLFPFSFEQLWKNNHSFFSPKNKNSELIEQPIKTESVVPTQTKKTYAKARIFAKSLEDVPALSDELRSSSEEIEVISKAAEIEKLKQLNHFLNILLLIVLLIGAVGGGLALGGNFLLTIERKRLQIAQLRLLGIGKKQITLFLWVQGIVITSTAFIMASLLSLITKLISELYSQDILGEVIQITNNEVKIFYLSGQDYLFAYMATLIFSSLVIVTGTKRANSIEPGEQLREI